MRSIAYIDGFNLYHRALKDTKRYKWLNPAKLCEILFPDHNIVKIKYFTARIRKQRQDDVSQRERQRIYLEALESLPNFEIIYGQFEIRKIPMLKADKPWGLGKPIYVWKSEEKMSDVNLASHLLRDGFMNLYDTAIVISNDSDFLTPLSMVQEAPLEKKLLVATPTKRQSNALAGLVGKGNLINIRERNLRESQFPDPVIVGRRKIHKPKMWP